MASSATSAQVVGSSNIVVIGPNTPIIGTPLSNASQNLANYVGTILCKTLPEILKKPDFDAGNLGIQGFLIKLGIECSVKEIPIEFTNTWDKIKFLIMKYLEFSKHLNHKDFNHSISAILEDLKASLKDHLKTVVIKSALNKAEVSVIRKHGYDVVEKNGGTIYILHNKDSDTKETMPNSDRLLRELDIPIGSIGIFPCGCLRALITGELDAGICVKYHNVDCPERVKSQV